MNEVKEITTRNKSTIPYIHVSTVIKTTEIDPKARRTNTTVKKDYVVMEVDNQPEEDIVVITMTLMSITTKKMIMLHITLNPKFCY